MGVTQQLTHENLVTFARRLGIVRACWCSSCRVSIEEACSLVLSLMAARQAAQQ